MANLIDIDAILKQTNGNVAEAKKKIQELMKSAGLIGSKGIKYNPEAPGRKEIATLLSDKSTMAKVTQPMIKYANDNMGDKYSFSVRLGNKYELTITNLEKRAAYVDEKKKSGKKGKRGRKTQSNGSAFIVSESQPQGQPEEVVETFDVQ